MAAYSGLSHTEKVKADALVLLLHGQFPSAPPSLLEEVAAEAVENGETDTEAANSLRARMGLAPELPPPALEMLLQRIDQGLATTLRDLLALLIDQPDVSGPKSLTSILVVGDGDLSFSLALQEQFALGPRLTATVYAGGGGGGAGSPPPPPPPPPPGLSANKQRLQRAAVDVREGVDVMRLPPDLAQPGRFDAVIFNFPHNGLNAHTAVKWGNKELNVQTHNYLLERYFATCKGILKPHGLAVVSVKARQKPYVWWNTREIGGLYFNVCRQLAFDPTDFPGYGHRRTLLPPGMGGGQQRQVTTRRAHTFVFCQPTLAERVRSDFDYDAVLGRALAEQRARGYGGGYGYGYGHGEEGFSSDDDDEEEEEIDERVVYRPPVGEDEEEGGRGLW